MCIYIYMYMYMCIFTHVYVHIYIYIYTHRHTYYVYIYVYISMRIVFEVQGHRRDPASRAAGARRGACYTMLRYTRRVYYSI